MSLALYPSRVRSSDLLGMHTHSYRAEISRGKKTYRAAVIAKIPSARLMLLRVDWSRNERHTRKSADIAKSKVTTPAPLDQRQECDASQTAVQASAMPLANAEVMAATLCNLLMSAPTLTLRFMGGLRGVSVHA